MCPKRGRSLSSHRFIFLLPEKKKKEKEDPTVLFRRGEEERKGERAFFPISLSSIPKRKNI